MCDLFDCFPLNIDANVNKIGQKLYFFSFCIMRIRAVRNVCMHTVRMHTVRNVCMPTVCSLCMRTVRNERYAYAANSISQIKQGFIFI